MKLSPLFVAGTVGVLVVASVALFMPGTKEPVAKPATAITPQPQSAPAHADSAVAPQQPATAAQSTSSADSATTADAAAAPGVAERLEAIRQRRPNMSVSSQQVEAAMKRESAWAPAKETPKNLPLEQEELTDGRQFIELDSLKIETLMPGDTVKVAIEETGEEYVVAVDRIEQHDYNSVSWYGHINGSDGHTYQVSFTRGEHLTVGGMDTPEGHYMLQAHGNNGWLASSALLFKHNPDVPDVMYPHEEGQESEHSH